MFAYLLVCCVLYGCGFVLVWIFSDCCDLLLLVFLNRALVVPYCVAANFGGYLTGDACWVDSFGMFQVYGCCGLDIVFGYLFCYVMRYGGLGMP